MKLIKKLIKIFLIFCTCIGIWAVLNLALDRECHRMDCDIEHWKSVGYPIGD
jgi:hypothetical protein